MRFLSKRTVLQSAVTTLAYLAGLALASGQPAERQNQPPPERVFKNVQVLKGLPVDRFMATMSFISASLGMTCSDCHSAESGGSWEHYADDTELKQTTRKMLVMVSAINRTYFGGRREITCYSCHRGGDRPRVTPSLIEQYGPPPPAEPPDALQQAVKPTPVDPVLDKFLQAIGGAQRLTALTSFVAKGSYTGFGETEKTPLEIFAKAPAQRTMIVHTPIGDITTTYDGRTGWSAAPYANSPVPVLEMSDGDRQGAKLDADLSFPAHIKQALTQWRAGNPATIGDRAVQVVQGTSDGRFPVDLYFDSQSGLLLRQVRFSDSTLGLNPTQIDYEDYREVAGVKMPFRWIVTWLSGKSVIELTGVQANVPIDAAKFAKPAPPASRR